MNFKATPSLILAFTLFLATSAAPALADIDEAIKQAMASEIRSDAEKARDRNRRPLETLKFFGLESDMRVLELIPGGGWYTKILAPVLAEDGQLLVAMNASRIQAMLDDGTLENVEIVDVEQGASGRAEGSRRFRIEDIRLNTSKIDLALTFRNLHNLDADTRDALNKEVFRVLNKGGLYGVVDHTRRHMQGDSDENWRRMDPVLVIKEIEAAGFEFVDFSDLHYRYDDELLYEVGRRSVAGNTDRFTLLFRKPK